jgi:hypothetical protein
MTVTEAACRGRAELVRIEGPHADAEPPTRVHGGRS